MNSVVYLKCDLCIPMLHGTSMDRIVQAIDDAHPQSVCCCMSFKF